MNANCTLARGGLIEKRVSRKLKKLGIRNELQKMHAPFDIELSDNRRIDVKAAFHTIQPQSQYAPYYYFKINKRKRGEYTDFFVLVIVPTNTYYIVPSEAAPADMIRIQALPKGERQKKHSVKWEQYRERWDLLQ